MTTKDTCLEIEIDANNTSVLFPPLGDRRLRGRFDFGDCAAPNALQSGRAWGGEIPGQIIGVDLENQTGYVREPLHDMPDLKEQVAKRNRSLSPKEERMKSIDFGLWCYWLGRLVESGYAKVLRGELPSDAMGKRGTLRMPKRNPRDATIDKLISLLYLGLAG